MSYIYQQPSGRNKSQHTIALLISSNRFEREKSIVPPTPFAAVQIDNQTDEQVQYLFSQMHRGCLERTPGPVHQVENEVLWMEPDRRGGIDGFIFFQIGGLHLFKLHLSLMGQDQPPVITCGNLPKGYTYELEVKDQGPVKSVVCSLKANTDYVSAPLLEDIQKAIYGMFPMGDLRDVLTLRVEGQKPLSSWVDKKAMAIYEIGHLSVTPVAGDQAAYFLTDVHFKKIRRFGEELCVKCRLQFNITNGWIVGFSISMDSCLQEKATVISCMGKDRCGIEFSEMDSQIQEQVAWKKDAEKQAEVLEVWSEISTTLLSICEKITSLY
ncbi:hypothetical protein [Persicobacter diffluens]|uniref:Uncharacterized protein n=1 Tax=Persicobacter diffluens TaxID=981 RepID=A0AAN5ALE4_9BACT|nr:hypothetical protein PEDI_19130 [Persicobacter diffluens]